MDTGMEWEETVCPVPKLEEPECPAPKWEEPEHPLPKRSKPECPQPMKRKPTGPEPKYQQREIACCSRRHQQGKVTCCFRLHQQGKITCCSRRHPVEGDYLLSPPLSPAQEREAPPLSPGQEGEALLSPMQEEDCLPLPPPPPGGDDWVEPLPAHESEKEELLCLHHQGERSKSCLSLQPRKDQE
ncbi:UNVERIFIED_CONTAM: hypothetical protein FKN15_044655 [Acipenser sinensis]